MFFGVATNGLSGNCRYYLRAGKVTLNFGLLVWLS